MTDIVIPEVDLDSELDQIIQALECADDKYPRAAIAQARQHRDAIIPRLLAVLKRDIDDLLEKGEFAGGAGYMAVMLLADFGVKQALPLILQAVRLPDEGNYEFFGDALHEELPRVIGILADSPDEFADLIDDLSLDEYARCTVMNAYLQMVYDGKITQEEAAGRLTRHLRRALDRDDADGANWLANTLFDLSPCEGLEEIREGFERGLIHGEFFNLDYAEAGWKKTQETEFDKTMGRIAKERKTPLADCVDRYDWAGDRPPKPQSTYSPPLDYDDDFEPETPEGTIKYTQVRVGRNDPCPCGSGKKFKKCCGG